MDPETVAPQDQRASTWCSPPGPYLTAQHILGDACDKLRQHSVEGTTSTQTASSTPPR